ncbi:MAG: sulfotransferase domain-containing protein, partial [Pseudomonadota bacterium]
MPTIRTTRHRNYRGPVTDTDIWDVFALRPDDIIVDTPPKCGTTWMLNIVMMLIFGRAVPDAGSRDNAPWLDCAFADRPARAAFLDSLERRRCIKSHTPMDGIPYGPDPTYIVVFR